MAKLGIFDSGMGAIALYHLLVRQGLFHDYVIFCDSAGMPYGSKTPQYVRSRLKIAFEYFARVGCESIIIACNTAAAYLEKSSRARYINAIDATVSALPTTAKKIAILATTASCKSGAYVKAIEDRWRALGLVCPSLALLPSIKLASLIEDGVSADFKQSEKLVEQELARLSQDTDVLVLGCTHYSLLKTTFVAQSPHRLILDSCEACAMFVKKLPLLPSKTNQVYLHTTSPAKHLELYLKGEAKLHSTT